MKNVNPHYQLLVNVRKLLGVKIDSQLNFNDHLVRITKKASQKAHALARITPYVYVSKRKL